ncbi:autotransporter domain-containing protein [Bosea sp. 2YAB26]|uniref:autotransporter outer membrane beta-barrel domain-containing protein n=2 Tax=Pseudomonadota TaxID=1224 RepID=UPI003F8FCD86
MTDDDSVARLTAVAGRTLSVSFGRFGRNSTLYLGSATDTGNINVTGWTGFGGLGARLVIEGGNAIAAGQDRLGLADFGRSFRSITINDGATLQFSSYEATINRLEGGGAIGIAAALTIGGGTFSTSITGASRLSFQGDSIWTGVGAGIGTLEVRSGATLTTNNPGAVEAKTNLQIDGTYRLNSALAVDGLSGSGLIELGLGARLSAGSQDASSTFSGVISGSGGGLTKDGSGTLTLAGASTYTGATIVNGGTLQMGIGNALPSSTNITLNGGTWRLAGYDQAVASLAGNAGTTVALGSATLTLGGGSNIGFFGNITGTGGLTKVGANSQDLYGVNSYSGPTTVSGGMLRIALGGTLLNSRQINISGGAAFDAVSSNALSPQAVVTLSGANTSFRINGDQSIGALSGTAGAQVIFGAGRTLTVGGNNADSTFAGNVGSDGHGSLIKTGTGGFTLSGASSYTGSTTVDGGTLVVNGSIAASSGVTLNAGGTLGGSGTVPGVTVTGGTLSPGNSPGTLTVSGNLMMDAVSTYRAEVQGPLADRINVSGTAALAGTLQIVPLGQTFRFNSPYTLLSAAGGRSGTFGTVDTTGAFGDGVTTTVSYTAQDVQLTLTPRPLTPGGSGDPGSSPGSPPGSPSGSPALGVTSPRNAYAVAASIDRAVANGGDASPLFNLYNQPASAIPAVVNQLSGEIHASVPALGFQAANAFLGTMLDPNGRGRLAGAAGAPGGAAGFTAGLPSKGSAAGPATFDPARFSLWGAPFGSRGRNDGERLIGSANRTLDDAHLAVGADVLLAPGTVAGVAVAAGQARASLSGGLGKIHSDAFQAGLYGLTRLGPVNLAAAGGYARLDNDVHRAVPALGNALSSSYASTAWSGRLQATAALASWNGLTISPLAALQAVHVRSPTFTEGAGFAGNAGALSVARRNAVTSRWEVGFQLDGQAMVGAVPVTGFARAAWAHYVERDASLAASLIALPGASFAASGARPDRDSALIAAGLDAKFNERVSLGIRLDSELSTNTRSLGGTARLAVNF